MYNIFLQHKDLNVYMVLNLICIITIASWRDICQKSYSTFIWKYIWTPANTYNHTLNIYLNLSCCNNGRYTVSQCTLGFTTLSHTTNKDSNAICAITQYIQPYLIKKRSSVSTNTSHQLFLATRMEVHIFCYIVHFSLNKNKSFVVLLIQ